MKRNYFFILYTISRRIFRSRASEKLDFAAELGPFSHLLYKRNFHRMPRDDRRLNVSGASGLCRHPSGSGTHGRERAPSNSALFFFTRFSSSDSLAVRASAGISTNFASFFLYLPSSASLSSPPPPLLDTLHCPVRKYRRCASLHLRREFPPESARVQPRLRIAFRQHPLQLRHGPIHPVDLGGSWSDGGPSRTGKVNIIFFPRAVRTNARRGK